MRGALLCLFLVAVASVATALRVPPATHQVLRSARAARPAAHAVRMVEDEDAPPELTEAEAEAFRKREEFEAAVLAAREETEVKTEKSLTSLPTKIVSSLIVVAVFYLFLNVFDPSNCAFLAPVKDVCIDYS